MFRFSEQEENPQYVLVVQGRPIVGLRLSAGGKMRPLLRPMVKYVGNMHGNELAGRQVLIALAEYLVHNYGVDDRVTRLLNTTEVMPLPSITQELMLQLPNSSDPSCADDEPGRIRVDLPGRGLVAYKEKCTRCGLEQVRKRCLG